LVCVRSTCSSSSLSFCISWISLQLPRPFKIVPCRYELPHVVPSCYGALRCNPGILKISIISVFICIFLNGVPPHHCK
jgi:hypothetical protein